MTLTEALGIRWNAYPVSFSRPPACDLLPGASVAVRDLTRGELLPAQIAPDGRLWLLADLLAYEQRRFVLEPDAEIPATDVQAAAEPDVLVLSSRLVAIGVARVDREDPTGLKDVPAPLSWIRGPEGIRRGSGRWAGSAAVVSVRSEITAAGPVFAEARMTYRLAGGGDYGITWRVYSRAPVAIAEEHKTTTGGEWRFSLYESFSPDTVHWRYGTSGVWALDYGSDVHICRHIYCNHWDLYQDFKEVSFVYRVESGDQGDAIGVFPVDGDGWQQVVTNIISLDVTMGPDVRYSFSLSPGRRAFGVFAVPLAQTREAGFEPTAEAPTDGVGAYKLRNAWSLVRLDEVKDMVLDWDPPPRHWPWMYASAEDVAAAQRKVRRFPQRYGDLARTSALFTDDPQVVDACRREFLDRLEGMVRTVATYGPNGENCNPVMLRPILHMPFFYEMLSMRGALSAAQDRRARAQMAFLAYFTDREDYDFSRRSLLPRGHPEDIMSLYKGMRAENMSIDRWIGVGLLGTVLVGHPRSAHWRRMALEAFRRTMDTLVGECGAWCEGWNYYTWSLHLLLNYAHVMRRCGHDLFADAAFKSMIRFVILSISPPNPAYEGRRNAPGFGSYGETSGESMALLTAKAAAAYRSSDPQFAAELMWASQELGRPFCSSLNRGEYNRAMTALFCDFDLPARQPALESMGCPGFGAIFRHANRDRTETFLIARASPYWPHGHTDPGSFFLYFHNAPLVTEAARGRNEGHAMFEHEAQAHNIIRFGGRDPWQYVWPCRQNLERFVRREGLEYAVLDCRQEALLVSRDKSRGHGDAATVAADIRHYRHILFLKPNVFVIYDVFDKPVPSDYRLHVYADGVSFHDGHAVFTGNHGVDLDVEVVLPEAPAFSARRTVDTYCLEFANGPGCPYLVVLRPCSEPRHVADRGFVAGVLPVPAADGPSRVRFEPAREPGTFGFVRSR